MIELSPQRQKMPSSYVLSATRLSHRWKSAKAKPGVENRSLVDFVDAIDEPEHRDQEVRGDEDHDDGHGDHPASVHAVAVHEDVRLRAGAASGSGSVSGVGRGEGAKGHRLLVSSFACWLPGRSATRRASRGRGSPPWPRRGTGPCRGWMSRRSPCSACSRSRCSTVTDCSTCGSLNSCSVPMIDESVVSRMAGAIIGSLICSAVRSSPAPSIRAASYISRGTRLQRREQDDHVDADERPEVDVRDGPRAPCPGRADRCRSRRPRRTAAAGSPTAGRGTPRAVRR